MVMLKGDIYGEGILNIGIVTFTACEIKTYCMYC